MERPVANRRVRCLLQVVIGVGKTDGGGRVGCGGAREVEAEALGAFLFTTSTQEPGTQAAGPEVLRLVAKGTGGGSGAATGAADAIAAVRAGGEE